MAQLEGTWTPETEAEMSFITGVNGLAKEAYDEGVTRDDIISALSFMAASFAMYEDDGDGDDEGPDADPGPLPRESEDIEDCPECGTEIEEVQTFIGGECIVHPCTCHVDYTRLPGWVDNDGQEDGDDA